MEEVEAPPPARARTRTRLCGGEECVIAGGHRIALPGRARVGQRHFARPGAGIGFGRDDERTSSRFRRLQPDIGAPELLTPSPASRSRSTASDLGCSLNRNGLLTQCGGNLGHRAICCPVTDRHGYANVVFWCKAVVRNSRARYAQAMTLNDTQGRLAAILAAEEASSVDWSTVDRLCDELDRELGASREDVPEIVAHFLSDSDIRARDVRYGNAQREAIRTYLKTGDYFDGVALPWWSCLTLLVVAGGVAVWAVA